ncbi:hypothetical protein PENSPDRAFT_647301 [Peniophora sp. CONT]|nr:hypothetical protein PENSPDRAFT_647301 [Peniophora sp. CONT]
MYPIQLSFGAPAHSIPVGEVVDPFGVPQPSRRPEHEHASPPSPFLPASEVRSRRVRLG